MSIFDSVRYAQPSAPEMTDKKEFKIEEGMAYTPAELVSGGINFEKKLKSAIYLMMDSFQLDGDLSKLFFYKITGQNNDRIMMLSLIPNIGVELPNEFHENDLDLYSLPLDAQNSIYKYHYDVPLHTSIGTKYYVKIPLEIFTVTINKKGGFLNSNGKEPNFPETVEIKNHFLTKVIPEEYHGSNQNDLDVWLQAILTEAQTHVNKITKGSDTSAIEQYIKESTERLKKLVF